MSKITAAQCAALDLTDEFGRKPLPELMAFIAKRSTPPRYTNLPNVGTARLIEGSRTNLALYSDGRHA